jgi:hypothetical protein
LEAIVLSLSANPQLTAVVYFDARAEERQSKKAIRDVLSSFAHFSPQGPEWDANLEVLPSLGPDRTGVLLVDGHDFAKVFHGGGPLLKPKPLGQGVLPSEAFRTLLDDGPRKGWYVVAIADNWKRVASSCSREVLALFQLRIGFCLNEDDAGNLFAGNFGKFKGLEKATRAVFVDQLRNHPVWFRPFRPTD